MPLYTAPLPEPAIGSSTDAITARSGGGTSLATVLTSQFNHVTTVAAANDSVKLPPWAPGVVVHVANDGANTLAVFPDGGGLDRINSGAAGASITVASGKTASFTGTGSANRWHGVLSA